MAAGRKRPGYAALCSRLPELKKLHPWLCEPPAQALQLIRGGREPALRERRERLSRLGELDLVPDLPMSGSGLQQLRDLRRGLGQ